MAPKKNRDSFKDAPGLTEEQQAAFTLSQRLQAVAKCQGVLAGSRRVVSKESTTPKLLLKADGKDLVKKSSQRKGRYLLNICAQIAPAAAGKLGSLAQLDSQNPVLYIDFPQGRLKFLGTIVFPKNKYMLLKFGHKDVLCEDVFENMIIFPEAHWVGTIEENPTEKQLPMPAELQSAVQHEKYTFGGEPHRTGPATQPSQTQPEAEDDDGTSDEDDMEEGPSQPTRISSRHKGKRPRYAEPGNSGSDAEKVDLDDSSEEEAPQKLPKLSQQGTPAQSKRRKSSGMLEDLSQPKSKTNSARAQHPATKAVSKATVRRGVVASSSDEEDSAPAPPAKRGASAKKQPTMSAFLSHQPEVSRKGSSSQPLPGTKKSAAAGGEKKIVEVIDLLEDDPALPSQNAQDSSKPSSASRAPRRARAGTMKSLREPSCSKDDDKESQGSSDVEVQSVDDDTDEDFKM